MPQTSGMSSGTFSIGGGAGRIRIHSGDNRGESPLQLPDCDPAIEPAQQLSTANVKFRSKSKPDKFAGTGD